MRRGRNGKEHGMKRQRDLVAFEKKMKRMGSCLNVVNDLHVLRRVAMTTPLPIPSGLLERSKVINLEKRAGEQKERKEEWIIVERDENDGRFKLG